MQVDPKLIQFLEDQLSGRAPFKDIVDHVPGFSRDDAHRLQFALMDRRAATGDPVVGYKAAYTSVAMQKEHNEPGPRVGTVTRSQLFGEGQLVPLDAETTLLEPEITVLLKRDLKGPNVTFLDAVLAVEGYFPSFEVAPLYPETLSRSKPHAIAMHKTQGGFVVGNTMVSPHGIDLRTEGAVLSLNNRVTGSGTGVEVLGNPLNAVIEIANTLGKFGRTLSAGMLVMTGSVVNAAKVTKKDESVTVEFTRIGKLTVPFAKR